MTWPVALLLAVSTLFAVALVGGISAMIGLAVCETLHRLARAIVACIRSTPTI